MCFVMSCYTCSYYILYLQITNLYKFVLYTCCSYYYFRLLTLCNLSVCFSSLLGILFHQEPPAKRLRGKTGDASSSSKPTEGEDNRDIETLLEELMDEVHGDSAVQAQAKARTRAGSSTKPTDPYMTIVPKNAGRVMKQTMTNIFETSKKQKTAPTLPESGGPNAKATAKAPLPSGPALPPLPKAPTPLPPGSALPPKPDAEDTLPTSPLKEEKKEEKFDGLNETGIADTEATAKANASTTPLPPGSALPPKPDAEATLPTSPLKEEEGGKVRWTQ